MTPEILSVMHKLQLEILLEINRICRKHGIQYWLSAGTLLGAVRHQGFIPWDDDADVQMLREDYERFCKVCPQELDNKRFFWQTIDTDPGYRWTYGKVRRKGTRYVRSGQEHMNAVTGVFADVIPIDGRPDNRFMDWIQYNACRYARRILWSPVGAVQEKNAVKRFLYRILSKIPKDFVYSVYMCFATRYSPNECRRVTRYCFDIFNKQTHRDGRLSIWFQGAVDVSFEGHCFPAPLGAEEELRYYYGNYMELPAVEDRHGNTPASLIELPDE